MYHWKTGFLTLVLFGLGGVAGGLVTAEVIKGKIERVKSTPAPGDFIAEGWLPQMLPVMQRQLRLTPDQVQRVRDDMRHAQEEILHAREEFRLRARGAITRSDEAIREILDDSQRREFEEFRRKRGEMIRRRAQNGMAQRPGDPPGPWREGGAPPFRPPPNQPLPPPRADQPAPPQTPAANPPPN